MGKQKITVVKIKKLRRYKRFALEEVAESKKENKKPLMYFLFTKLSPKNYQIMFIINMIIISLFCICI